MSLYANKESVKYGSKQNFRKAPLPKLSKSGYLAMMTDEEAVKIITGKIYANY